MIPFGGGIRINENLQYSAALHTEFFCAPNLTKMRCAFFDNLGHKKTQFCFAKLGFHLFWRRVRDSLLLCNSLIFNTIKIILIFWWNNSETQLVGFLMKVKHFRVFEEKWNKIICPYPNYPFHYWKSLHTFSCRNPAPLSFVRNSFLVSIQEFFFNLLKIFNKIRIVKVPISF